MPSLAVIALLSASAVLAEGEHQRSLIDYSWLGRVVPADAQACGVACLYAAAKNLNLTPDIDEIGRNASLGYAGSSLLDLKKAAPVIGLTAEGYK